MPEAGFWTPVYSRMFDPDHELADEPACKRWAWADICHMSQKKSATRIVRGQPVKLARGEVLASVRYLAERWSWSRSRVQRFLTLLQHPTVEKLETVRETHGGTVYRVVSHEDYALPWDAGEDANKDGGVTQAGQIIDRSRSKRTSEAGSDLVAAVGRFLVETGASWRLQESIEDWATRIQREPKYAGADLAYEVGKATDWHVGKKRKPDAPDISIRNWLERAASRAQEKAKPKQPGLGLRVLP